MTITDEISCLVEAKRRDFEALSEYVWQHPELAYEEFRSVAAHIQAAEREGFRVKRNVADIPTAMMAEVGEDGPVIAFLGEYDALPCLSQQAGIAEHRPVEANGHGHACGHNLLGAGALLAASSLKEYLRAHRISGRVRYYGCPAEEGGAGKGFMVRAGAFDDVDVALTWHPSSFNGVMNAVSLSNVKIDFHFTGRAAHAVTAHLGRSALDAVELMNIGVNYLREHLPRDASVHYAIVDTGGIAPNVVQANATVRYVARVQDLFDLQSLVERLKKVAGGAALMTETAVRSEVLAAVANLLGNTPLESAMHENFLRLDPLRFNADERAFAAKIQTTLTEQEIAFDLQRIGPDVCREAPLFEGVVSPIGGPPMMGSTDVGDVSWVVPTVEARGATYAVGTQFHTWQMTAQSRASAAHKAMSYVAKAMAATGFDVIQSEALLAQAKADHQARVRARPYVCPIPSETPVPLGMSHAG